LFPLFWPIYSSFPGTFVDVLDEQNMFKDAQRLVSKPGFRISSMGRSRLLSCFLLFPNNTPPPNHANVSLKSGAGVAVMGVDRKNDSFFNHLKWTLNIFRGYATSIGW